MSVKHLKARKLLKYILAGFATGLVLMGLSVLISDGPVWFQRFFTLIFGVTIWLDWHFGIQGVAQLIESLVYSSLIGGIIGCIQIFIKSKGVKVITWVLFIGLFFLLNYVSSESVFRDMGRLGEMYGKRLVNDPEFAREFMDEADEADEDDTETKALLLKDLERLRYERFREFINKSVQDEEAKAKALKLFTKIDK